MTSKIKKQMAAEFFGTFALVFVGTGAIVLNDVMEGAVTHAGISLAFGLVVMAMVFLLGGTSGAHINPAVTLGFWASRRFPSRKVLPYISAQIAGGLLASLFLWILFPTHTTLGATIPTVAVAQTFLLEIFLTLILMWVILTVATGSKELGRFAAIAIGGVIGLEAFFAGPLTGASMNPARSLAPALVSGELSVVWIYLSAPIIGAFLAVPLCRCVRKENCCEPISEPVND